MNFRKASKVDAFILITLYQKAYYAGMVAEDELYHNYRRLEEAIGKGCEYSWILAENDKHEVIAAIALWIEPVQRLCKITKMLVDPSAPFPDTLLRTLLRYILNYLETEVKNIDVVYTTTLSMTLAQQELTLEEGFRILGVFPNLTGEDNSHLNGLSGYFFKGVLQEKRVKNIKMHPAIYPFFAISRKEFELDDVVISDNIQNQGYQNSYSREQQSFETLPILELVKAPRFVRKRFENLRENHSQINHFYPFYRPNCLITDSCGEIEIFCRIHHRLNFAAIIGEHLSRTVCPVSLYREVQNILKMNNISYIEIINDASDIYGNDCILKADFTPCAYFPAFKLQGQTRRDFVVFGKSFEYLCRPNLATHPSYIEFYREYFKIEGKNYFPNF